MINEDKIKDDIKILVEAGFFEFKNGTAICHRDSNGKLRIIEIKEIKFKS